MVSSSPISINLFFFLLILGPCLGLLPDFSIVGYSDEDLSSSDRLLDLFESWVAEHGKSYAGFAEKLRRFEVFKDNLRHIDAANREGNYSYWLGLNEFADLTHEEFKVKYLGVRADAPSGRRSSASSFSGYMAPEYAMDGFFSAKSDVFSFGIVLLEIISGASNGRAHGERHGQSLLGHAWDMWNKDKATELIDPLLENQYSLAEAMKCISLGLLCVQKDAEVRPTMSAVVLVLQSDHIVLPQPSSPPKY